MFPDFPIRFLKRQSSCTVISPDFWEGCGSEQISVGAQLEPLLNVERFLCILRFEQREKLEQLGIEIDTLD